MAFFDLAHANRDKSASGGQRIGESGFDQRMQALRRIQLDVEADDVFMLQNWSKDDEEGEGKLIDPVRWYGLLASQSLKDAQGRFVKVLEEGVEVVNVMAKLRTSELNILELRKRKAGGEMTLKNVTEPDSKITGETSESKKLEDSPTIKELTPTEAERSSEKEDLGDLDGDTFKPAES